MRYHAIANVPFPVSALCLGAGAWGSSVPVDEAARIYAAYRAGGGNFFDTAHCYAFWEPGIGAGSSERALGELIRHFGDRGNVVVGTKGGHPASLPKYPRPDRYMSPEMIASDIHDSLERLGTRRLDLFYLHRDDARMPVEEIMDALHEHVRGGRVRALGASNWSASRIAQANAYAARNDKTPFAISQPMYSLGIANPPGDPTMRELAAEDYRWHEISGLPLCAYSSNANGYFAGGGKRGVGGWDNAASRERLAVATAVAAEMGCTPGQVALTWLVAHPFPTFAAISTNNHDHLREALAAMDVCISGEQFVRLSTAGMDLKAAAR